jgi:hypothetical protein
MVRASGGAARTTNILVHAIDAHTVVALAGCGLVLIAACWGLTGVQNLALAPARFLTLFTMAFAAYAAGAWVASGLRGRRALGVILAVSAFTRLLLLPLAPSLSTDLYRYVWDARVSAAGFDPYAFAPAAAEMAALRDDQIYPRLNHATWLTVYPPVAQAFFQAVYRLAPDSALGLKLALGIAELLALAALALLLKTLGLPLGRLVIYAWSPLVLIEIWGSGHIDALVLAAVTTAMLASARGRDAIAAGLLAVGTLVKLYPAVLLVLFPGRLRPRVLASFAGVMVAGTLATGGMVRWPFGPIGRYVADEYFNPGLMRSLVNAPRLALLITALWVLIVAATRGAGGATSGAVPLVAGVTVLSPNVFPWYVVWLVPFLAITPSVPWIAFTGTVGFAYAFFLPDPWHIPAWARLVEVAPLLAGAVMSLRRRPRSAAPAPSPEGTGT